MNAAIRTDNELPWTPREVCEYLQNTVTEGTLAVWRSTGKGPKFFKSGRKPLYRPAAVRAWCAQNERGGEGA